MADLYLAAAAWLFLVDVLHRRIAGEPLAVVRVAAYAAIWPLSIAYFSLHRAAAKRARSARP